MSTAAPSQPVIDRFLDALWIEDGLAANTLAAYRRDLELFAAWLGREQGREIGGAFESDLLAYAAHRHGGSRATSANRRRAHSDSIGASAGAFCRWTRRVGPTSHGASPDGAGQ